MRKLLVLFLAAVCVCSSQSLPYYTQEERAMITNNDLPYSPVDACFTPGERCDLFIRGRIDKAKTEVLVQAYHLTNDEIVSALCLARQARKVKVIIILDKAASAEGMRFKYSCLPKDKFYDDAFIYVDYKKAIAHNKVIVIDGSAVITGSYNFTEAAQSRNAENVLYVQNPEIVRKYREYFMSRLEQSRLLRDYLKN